MIRLLKWKMTPNLLTKFTLEIRKKKVDALICDTLPGKFDYYIIVSSIFGFFFFMRYFVILDTHKIFIIYKNLIEVRKGIMDKSLRNVFNRLVLSI